jgi:hypothetical protein
LGSRFTTTGDDTSPLASDGWPHANEPEERFQMSHANATRISDARRAGTALLCALAALAGTAACAQAAPAIGAADVDWTAATDVEASGKLFGKDVKLGGGGPVTPAAGGAVFDESSVLFATPAFSPALPQSDLMQIFGPPKAGGSFAYTITFGTRVVNPILHLGSLASWIVFNNGTPVKRSGALAVNGASVSSYPLTAPPSPGQPTDVDGSIQIVGTFGDGTSATGYAPAMSFTTKPPPWASWASKDGIHFQLAVPSECVDWTDATATTVTGKLGARSVILTTQTPDPARPLNYGPPTLGGNSTYFANRGFSPQLTASDAISVWGPASAANLGYHYQLSFPDGWPQGSQRILHIGSLASTITFDDAPATLLRRWDSRFQVNGSTVSGSLWDPTPRPFGLNDANGSVLVANTTAPIGFKINAPANYAQQDGIYLQVCAAG